jgi:hypothetical protein
MPKQGKQLCPEGVAKACRYCVEFRGTRWHVLDPHGKSVDEAPKEKQAIDIAEELISACKNSESGYGNVKEPVVFDPGKGPFSWG